MKVCSYAFIAAVLFISSSVLTPFVSAQTAESLAKNRSERQSFRIHGVTDSFVRSIADLGYDNLDADDLISFRIHGVDADFLSEI